MAARKEESHEDEAEEGSDAMDVDDEVEEEQELPFLDTFYDLTSTSPSDRAVAAHAMLKHCLLDDETKNVQDATYAFQRLMNGLCSGRASARQGYASAITSFLRIAFSTGTMNEIRQQEQGKSSNQNLKDEKEGVVQFVRDELLRATDSEKKPENRDGKNKFGKKKGSEERDFRFGRLFGIMAVVRSGIILQYAKGTEIMVVVRGFTNDLVDLYHHKKWMAEPAAFALILLLRSLYEKLSTSNKKDVSKPLDAVVREIVIPRMLNKTSTTKSYSPEQVAVALFIQMNGSLPNQKSLPQPLDKPIFTAESIVSLAESLASTSSIAQPRTHVVWDVLVSYLTQPATRGSRSSKAPQQRVFRSKAPYDGSNDSPSSLVATLMEHVVENHLLGVDKENRQRSEGGESSSLNATHDRKALGLTLIKLFCGGPYGSTLDGLVALSCDSIESILSPKLVQKLFLDVICTSGKKEHLLRPLALNVLDSIVLSIENAKRFQSDCQPERRLSMVKSLVRAEASFDARTKTDTIASLLQVNNSNNPGSENSEVPLSQTWKGYLSFLQKSVLDSIQPHEAIAYIDQMFWLGKTLARQQTSHEDTMEIIKHILSFMMTGAFFNLGKMKSIKSSSKAVFDMVADLIRKSLPKGSEGELPHSVRLVMSSRFFSLLGESLVTGDANISKAEKEKRILQQLSFLCQGWRRLNDLRGAQFTKSEREPERFVLQIQEDALSLYRSTMEGEVDAEKIGTRQCMFGSATMSSLLYLQLLRCGGATEEQKDEIHDEDEIENSDILEMISDLAEVTQALLDCAKGKHDDNDSNPLEDLIQLCLGVMSSFPSDEERRATQKVLREGTKVAWIGGLSAVAARSNPLVSDRVVEILLESCGIQINQMEDADDDSDSDDEEEEPGVFAQAANMLDDSSVEKPRNSVGEGDDDETDNSSENDDSEDRNNVEISPSKLQSLLLQDPEDESETEEDMLEHHEGADAALGKLIKLKQEARKVGQLVRERAEVRTQLRCTVFLETLLHNSGRTWGKLFDHSTWTRILSPMLTTTRKMGKSCNKMTLGQKPTSGQAEKQALLKKLTVLLKTKICKLRFDDNTKDTGALNNAMKSVLDETRRAATQLQRECCNASFLFLCRLAQNDLNSHSQILCGAVADWSTKRTTRLKADTFEGLINQQPSVALSVLIKALCTAMKDGRSAFIKGESFRLLSVLIQRNTPKGDEAQSLDSVIVSRLKENLDDLVAGCVNSLGSEEMRKTKRSREVLKAVEKVQVFLLRTEVTTDDMKKLKALQLSVEQLHDTHRSLGKNCAVILSKFEELQSMAKPPPEATPTTSSKTESKQSKKKSKKRKKR